MNGFQEGNIFNSKVDKSASAISLLLSEEIKKLGEHNPQQLDSILRTYAQEVLDKVREFSTKENNPAKVDKENIELVLESVESPCVDNLSRIFKEINEGSPLNENFNFSDRSDDVDLSVKTLGKYISLELGFHKLSGSAEYGFSIDYETTSDYKIQALFRNIHREISSNLRGHGMGKWLEKMSERAAKRAHITELYFQSKDSFDSVIFPLTQGYFCETQKDRELAFGMLKYLSAHPEAFNDKEVRSAEGMIYFKKSLKDYK